MCRALMYLGKEIPLENLLYFSDNSLVKQAYDPKQMTSIQNLAGFGMLNWSRQFTHVNTPLCYRTTLLPFYDNNLASISHHISASSVLAHVRGVPYQTNEVISVENTHPFIFPGFNIAFAHNGVLVNHEALEPDMLKYIKPEIYRRIRGTTDSEWIYAIFLSRLSSLNEQYTILEIATAVMETLEILKHIRMVNKHFIISPINLFIMSGSSMLATRFTFDYGHFSSHTSAAHFNYHSLWYTAGEEYRLHEGQYKMLGYPKTSSVIIASEPLTADTSTWIAVPEYSLLTVEMQNEQADINIYDIDV